MARKINITISEYLDDDIHRHMDFLGKTNKSEFVEELIRMGFIEFKKQHNRNGGD